MTYLNSALFPLLLAIGFLAPGWLLGRCLGTASDPIAAFLGSAALLLNLVLALDALNIALTIHHVAFGLATICGVLALAAGFRHQNVAPPVGVNHPKWHWQHYHWLLLPAIIGFTAIAVKASLDPLSGFDTFFRWDFLARQMLNEENLHFYPAITADDFKHYAWCDGIAPLISSLYFWSYLSLGKAVEWATTPVVIGQAILLFLAVYRLAAHRGGPAAGCASMAILVTSPVLLWGVAIGQETGVTALSFVAMFLFIERDRETPGKHWLIWAGVAAGAGALAREYGLVFIGLGGLALVGRKISLRHWLEFLLAAAVVAFPWYVRNWFKTGNPLYSQGLGGLFPSNPILDEYARTVKVLIGLGTEAASPALLGGLVGSLAGVPLALGMAGMFFPNGRRLAWMTANAVVIGLWLWSINETSGGVVYSLRVLTPCIALGAAAGGPFFMRWAKGNRSWLAGSVLILLVVDSGVRSLFMPLFPKIAWYRESSAAWLKHRRLEKEWNNHPDWAAITEAADARQVLVIDPYSYTNFFRKGGNPTPLFSPTIRFLFDPKSKFASNLRELRKVGMRFILISDDRIMNPLLSLHPFFQNLYSTHPVMNTPMFRLYDLYSGALGETNPLAGGSNESAAKAPPR